MQNLASMSTWPAPQAEGPLDAVVPVPGSKSLTNRHLVLAALASEVTLIRRPLHSRDSELMVAALRSLGVRLTPADDDGLADPGGDHLLVTPETLQGGTAIDCGLAGTVMRFVPPLAALADGPVTFDGDERARERPMLPVIESLRALGVQVEDGGRGLLPFTVHGTGAVTGGRIEVDASASSQFVSALLLPAARFADGLSVHLVGGSMPSHPHVQMTVRTLLDLGVQVEVERDSAGVPHAWHVSPGPIGGGRVDIEPDLSNAGPFLAAALVAGGTVRIPGWPRQTTQAGGHWVDLLPRLGATVTLDGDELVVTGTGRISGIDADLHEVGELTPTVAALCALADSPSRLRGVAHLRGHETDRLAALATEIARLGGVARETEDGLEIAPARLHGGEVETYHDHRMATFAAVLGLRVPGVLIRDVGTTAKTLPDFTRMWQAMVGTGRAGSAEAGPAVGPAVSSEPSRSTPTHDSEAIGSEQVDAS